MNIKLFGSIFKAVMPFAGKIKQWIFADGKFSLKRAAVLLLAACLIGGSVNYLGVEKTEQIIQMTDEVSDIIGYSE